MRKILIIMLSLVCINSNGEWYTKLESNIAQMIKNDFFSDKPSYMIEIKVSKRDSLMTQEQLLIENYKYLINDKLKVIDIITVNYKDVDNLFLKWLRLLKTRGKFEEMQEKCPLVLSDRLIGLKLLRLTDIGFLHSTMDKSHISQSII